MQSGRRRDRRLELHVVQMRQQGPTAIYNMGNCHTLRIIVSLMTNFILALET
ncbi:hypothetical protein Poly59_06820 [Rubripirellula reticaptiva]|uniref:Uncharacterized protein n=1 Tax=Rubripirellula reticaptiva TaxID=2528013 RepID=A0A5C6F7T0_9BACT|nr:hypothetical protein Poly59_06820 [Rubripirellula reticaptiva]